MIKPDFSTILVVSTTRGETKSLHIKTKHINRFRHYLVTICLMLLILTGTIIFLSLEISKSQKEKLTYNREIALLKSRIPVPEDTLQARNYIQNIEGKLQKIDLYLRKRGIKGFATDNTGGNNDVSEDLSPEEIYALYNEHLEDVLTGIAFTPLGYPGNIGINSGFGYRNDPVRPGRVEFHPGIDFRGRKGDPVKSTADGKVIYAGWYKGYGNCIRIKHKNNLETLYGHLSKISVKAGQMIRAGEIIGRVGSTGYSTGDHLHYEIRKNGKPVNPRNFLSIN